MILGREERAPAVRARAGAVVVEEKGVGARVVESSSCSGLAGILFWSPGAPLVALDWNGIRGGNDRDGGGEGAVSGAGPTAAAQR